MRKKDIELKVTENGIIAIVENKKVFHTMDTYIKHININKGLILITKESRTYNYTFVNCYGQLIHSKKAIGTNTKFKFKYLDDGILFYDTSSSKKEMFRAPLYSIFYYNGSKFQTDNIDDIKEQIKRHEKSIAKVKDKNEFII